MDTQLEQDLKRWEELRLELLALAEQERKLALEVKAIILRIHPSLKTDNG